MEDVTGTYQGKQGKFITYFIPDEEPENLIRVPVTHANTIPGIAASMPGSASSSSPCCSTPTSMAKFSFKDVILIDKLQNERQPQQKSSGKRRKVNPYGSIVTSEEQFLIAENVNAEKGKRTFGNKNENKGKNDDNVSDTETVGTDNPEP